MIDKCEKNFKIPITTALAPTIFTPDFLINSIQPFGVHGKNPVKSPIANLRSFMVFKLKKNYIKFEVAIKYLQFTYPSTSLSGRTKSVTKCELIGLSDSNGI